MSDAGQEAARRWPNRFRDSRVERAIAAHRQHAFFAGAEWQAAKTQARIHRGYDLGDKPGADVDAVGRLITDATVQECRADVAETEVQVLQEWKEAAIAVLNDWEKVWAAAGRPGSLGESKAEAVRALLARVRAFAEERAKVADPALAASVGYAECAAELLRILAGDA